MKFDVFISDVAHIMAVLNDEGVRFKDTFVYLNHNGKLYTTSCVELRYCEEIDKYAFVIKLDDK